MPEVYRRRGSENWWIDITVAGRRYRESTKTPDKGLAEDIASKRAWELRRAAVFGAESVLTFGAATALILTQENLIDSSFRSSIFGKECS
jgi:hypothetical protein